MTSVLVFGAHTADAGPAAEVGALGDPALERVDLRGVQRIAFRRHDVEVVRRQGHAHVE